MRSIRNVWVAWNVATVSSRAMPRHRWSGWTATNDRCDWRTPSPRACAQPTTSPSTRATYADEPGAVQTARTVPAVVNDGHCTVEDSRAMPSACPSSNGTICTALTCAR